MLSFVVADAFDPPAALRRPVDHVFCNPPFHGDDGQVSPDAARARALQDGGQLVQWLVAGVKRTAPKGTFTAILRADRLGEALAALPERGVTVFPLWPRAGEPAKRVIVQVRKGSRAPLAVAAGAGSARCRRAPIPLEADAILRGGASLALDSARPIGSGRCPREPNRGQGQDIPGPHPDAAELLGGAGLSDPAAL